MALAAIEYSNRAYCSIMQITINTRPALRSDWRDTMTTLERENASHARRFNDEVWGQYDFDAIDDLVADEFVGYNPSLPEPVNGAEEFRAVAEMLHTAFPDIEVDIEQILVDGDWLAQRLTATATHEGEYMGVEPTGEHVEFAGMTVSRLEDGELVESHEQWDALGLLTRIGAVEPPIE